MKAVSTNSIFKLYLGHFWSSFRGPEPYFGGLGGQFEGSGGYTEGFPGVWALFWGSGGYIEGFPGVRRLYWGVFRGPEPYFGGLGADLRYLEAILRGFQGSGALYWGSGRPIWSVWRLYWGVFRGAEPSFGGLGGQFEGSEGYIVKTWVCELLVTLQV